MPDDKAVRALRRRFEHAYYASCFAVSPRLTRESPCWANIHAADAWIDCGVLGHGGWVVKCVANGSIALRRTLAAVRLELHAALGRREPSLRRAGWT